MKFGTFINQKRRNCNINFVDFCRDLQLEQSNWFSMERGIVKYPRDRRLLKRIADYLKLNDDDRNTLFLLAGNDKTGRQGARQVKRGLL